ncbi:PAS domain S-box protein [Pseudahrensia aquimaris]|uniref:histidine kinase n=1 Tax=Pseudahrensia aquimaris TaxID=744461 RepID=A0ABW3FAS5_9HYPH
MRSKSDKDLVSDSERLKDFADAASDWFFELDADLRFTYLSPNFEKIVGTSISEVLGTTPWEAHGSRVIPEEEQQWQSQLRALKAHEDWRDHAMTIIRDDGERRVLCNSAKAIFDDDGQFAGYRGAARDITHTAAAGARLSSIIDAVPDAIITIDEDGLVRSFSKAAEALFGYDEAEVIDRNVEMLMPSEHANQHDSYMDRYKRTGEKRIIGIGRRLEARKKDGTVFPINLAISEMRVEGRRLFTSVIQDISELVDAQTLSGRVGAILDRSLHEIYVFGFEDLRFVQVNHGARQNMGYSSGEFRQMTPVDVKPEYDESSFRKLIAPLRERTTELLVFKTKQLRKDGSTYPVEVHLQLMRDEDPPLYLAVVQDITEREKREQRSRQAHKMVAIGQLTGGIAHDFNNLLTVIIANNELLADMLEDDPDKRELVEDATIAAQHGATLTKQLLAFARQQPLAPQIVDLNTLIGDMMDMLQRTLGEDILVSTMFEKPINPVLIDVTQTNSALLNLAINARDAMPNGGELIFETSNVHLDQDAAMERGDANAGDYVRVSVRDTGTGMTSEVRDRVLEPFFTTKPVGLGTGLGLSMVHGFALQSGGFIEIYSEEGYGTAISFYLPVDKSSGGQTSETTVKYAPTAQTTKTILLVEDDERVRRVTLKRLIALGYIAVEATSGQQALDILRVRDDIDLVFTDMIMPGGMTGGDLLEIVASDYPAIKKLIASGYAEDGIIPNHGTKWLHKPYSIQELAETLSDIFE